MKETLHLSECLNDISFSEKQNIINSVSGQSLITVSMKYPEMKFIAAVILLWSF